LILKRNKKFKQYLFVIYAGEFFASAEDIIISTILGSCISVCLYDPMAKVGGMNHFMLPDKIQFDEDKLYTPDTRYGIHAMDILINQVLKKGATRENLKAKIFGGGSSSGKNFSVIGNKNARFAKKYLEVENILIETEDTGGKEARKIFFYPTTGKVFLKRIFKEPFFEKVEEQKEAKINKKIQEIETLPGFIDFNNF